MTLPNKTIVIGLDALPWTYLSPVLKRGGAPNLASLISSGCKGILNSTTPPTSPVAWSSFMTGVNPQKHKIFDFVGMEKGTYRTRTIDGRDRKEVGFWKYLCKSGIRCGICNLPLSFPAEKIDGFFISGFDSPPNSPNSNFPRELYNELIEKFGRNPFTYPNFTMKNYNKETTINNYLQLCLEREDIQTEIVLELAEKYAVDVLVSNYMAIDHFNHYLDDIEYIHRAIERLDYNIGKFINSYPDANFIIISDHGSKKIKSALLTYEWLKDMGYLIFKNKEYQTGRINAVLAHLLQDRWGMWGYTEKIMRKAISVILQLIPSAIQDKVVNSLISSDSVIFWPLDILDSKHSVIFNFQPGINGFRINLKGREPNGIIDPSDYHNIRNELMEKLTSLRDSESGDPLFEMVYRREDICNDIEEHMLPDILAISNNSSGCKLVSNLVVRRNVLSYPFVVTCETAKYFGEHTSEGIYIFSGPAFNQNEEGNTYNLTDITSLILYLHNVAIPKSFDGIVPLEVICSKSRKNQIEYQEKIVLQENGLKNTLDEKDRKDIEERLKNLGYL